VAPSWNPDKLESGKRDWKLAPKQLCEEFRAAKNLAPNGACAPNLNPGAKVVGAKSN